LESFVWIPPCGHHPDHGRYVPGIDAENAIFTDLSQSWLPGIQATFEARAREIHPNAPTIIDAIRRASPGVEYHPIGSGEQDAGPTDEGELAGSLEDVDIVIAVVGERTGWVGTTRPARGSPARASSPASRNSRYMPWRSRITNVNRRRRESLPRRTDSTAAGTRQLRSSECPYPPRAG
jgi:hypothetical protein